MWDRTSLFFVTTLTVGALGSTTSVAPEFYVLRYCMFVFERSRLGVMLGLLGRGLIGRGLVVGKKKPFGNGKT